MVTIYLSMQKQSDYTTIPVLPSTKSRIASMMPKDWNWDRCINELASMWEKHQGKVIRTGKPSEDNQTS